MQPLDRVLADVAVLELRGDPSVRVDDVTHSSVECRPGSLFCCLRGGRVDGHDHAVEAVENGASALLVERWLDGVPAAVAQARTEDSRPAMAAAAAACHHHPSRSLDVIGVTGTNGKTTTTRLVQVCLDADGRPCEVVGTMTGPRSTPESSDLQRLLASFVAAGSKAAAIEVSSVGLVQHRVDAIDFAVGVFTNLTPDELSIHGSVEDYFAAKATLFEAGRCRVGVVNADDPWGQRLLAAPSIAVAPLVSFSLAEVSALEVGPGWSRFRWCGQAVELALDGMHNVANALAAATVARELGVDAATSAAALSAVQPLAGHGQDVEAGQPFRVMVDFAHTAGAIEAVVASARSTGDPGARVILVFGSGGDRDKSRRALMGRAAARVADMVVVTSDNPRTEDPAAIIAMVVDGANEVEGGRRADVVVEPDRREAIAYALRHAVPGDVVIIAGKGHETGQIVGDTVLPFDDAAVARELLS